ncbi:MAG TPA: sugar phosphate isomerase/epimerase [Thermomicrobiales bacterium]|nr:sugar phosphate isomerase/epimerase [Thermomicrobiales bacterium]
MAGAAAMELTCTSFSFPLLPFERSARVIALLGLRYVDLGAHVEGTHLQPERIEADPRGEAARAREAIAAAGLGASDFFPTFGHGFRDRPVNTPDPAMRDANRRRFAAFVEFCAAVGCPGMTLLPGVIWDDLGPERSFDLAVEALAEFVRDGHAAGLRVGVEPHLESVVEEPERALALVGAVPGLQFTLDYSHFVAAGVAAERVHPLIPHAGHFHARQAAPGHLQTVRAEGTIDFADIVRRLQAAAYTGFLSIEYTWQEWRDCNRLDVLAESALLRDELRAATSRE